MRIRKIPKEESYKSFSKSIHKFKTIISSNESRKNCQHKGTVEIIVDRSEGDNVKKFTLLLIMLMEGITLNAWAHTIM
jgi:hypothetical protein